MSSSRLPDDLMPTTLFIADLHLAATEPATTETFFRFARDFAPHADALYVVGDLFDYWVGDDSLGEPFNQAIVRAFADISGKGTALFFMHGNRDFLLAESFAAACGGSLIPDPALLDLYGTPTLLMHGDTLCTDDVEYLRFRATVRDPQWQAEFLAKPLSERQALVIDMRGRSEAIKRQKPLAIMDVALPTVEATLRAHACGRLIHGHTHRPDIHLHRIDGRVCERWVLTDWQGTRGGYLAATPEGCTAHFL